VGANIGQQLVSDWNASIWVIIVRILICGVCGFIVGYERKSRSKEAGIRTHSIVCLSAGLLMVLSKYGFPDAPQGDAGRIAAQVVSGIGFLGAGIIIYRRDILHGLTTAAGVWATAGIGMCIGAGMVITGVFATFFLVSLQYIFHRRIKLFRTRLFHVIKLTCSIKDPAIVDQIKYIFEAKNVIKFKMSAPASEGEAVNAEVEVVTERLFTAKELLDIVAANPYIKTIEKNDEA